MKFICLGYLDETHWDAMSKAEQTTFMETCLAYDDELRRGGHFIGGEALQSIRNAATLRYQRESQTGPMPKPKSNSAAFYYLKPEI
ncbi:MAG: hypothetical protein AAF215_08415 [Cyanobacteria bacterium P01_A01_bin.123]